MEILIGITTLITVFIIIVLIGLPMYYYQRRGFKKQVVKNIGKVLECSWETIKIITVSMSIILIGMVALSLAITLIYLLGMWIMTLL